MFTNEIEAKRVGLLHQLIPAALTIAVLLHPDTPGFDVMLHDVQTAAAKLGLKLHVLKARSEPEIETAFTSLTQSRPDALLVTSSALFNSRRKKIVQLATRQAIPAIYEHRLYTEAGGLISYGIDLSDVYRQAGDYTGQILNGTKPANSPLCSRQNLSWSSTSRRRRR